ncbi:hypothetical protein BDY17DRAFT_300405 [Neohortaea acidophila]|uniref:Uncharacterized protein n=1 Tax=Neohortaea acidophila TaxID=245834 RepID=A0A6A6PPX4_9PEZI|nr:uncharacterized protein BDY17DRAFT_300405 [Neohortaea acidophila]KAF2482160.1 hypothetical protein BDY17DRAFT_300405 [Neohortaea acidophila]
MAPIFASGDIAALISAFPPPTPIETQPSLVRSLSGNTLLNSQKVLARFQALFRTEVNRIRLRDLPSRLGVKDTRWILDCYDGEVYFSSDKTSLVSFQEFETICNDLVKRSQGAFVDLYSFTRERDVSYESLEDRVRTGSLRSYSDPSHPHSVLVAGVEHVQGVRHELTRLMGDQGSTEKVRLSDRLPDIPHFILRVLTDEVRTNGAAVDGHIEENDQGLEFVPANFLSALQKKLQDDYNLAVQQSVQSLIVDGYCILHNDTGHPNAKMGEDIRATFELQSPSSEHTFKQLEADDGSSLIATSLLLKSVDDEWKAILRSSVEAGFVDSKPDPAMHAELTKRASKPNLTALLLKTTHRQRLDGIFDSAVHDAESVKSLAFARLLEALVLVPLVLYVAGLVEDATLRQHQEEFVGEYFRRDVISQVFARVRDEKLVLPAQRNRLKEIEKLQQTCSRTKTLTELHTAVDKFRKKCEIPPPDTDSIKQVQKATLRERIQAMQKMQRGSDVLQNLLWILLAQASPSDALFMSAGKDTSRMIKQYQLVARDGVGIGGKLEGWRNMLKAGKESREEVQEMRELAMRAVEDMFGVGVP